MRTVTRAREETSKEVWFSDVQTVIMSGSFSPVLIKLDEPPTRLGNMRKRVKKMRRVEMMKCTHRPRQYTCITRRAHKAREPDLMMLCAKAIGYRWRNYKSGVCLWTFLIRKHPKDYAGIMKWSMKKLLGLPDGEESNDNDM
jgi:hypothetical protein